MKIKHCNKNKGYLLIELFYSGDTGYFAGSGPVKFSRHNREQYHEFTGKVIYDYAELA